MAYILGNRAVTFFLAKVKVSYLTGIDVNFLC